MKGENIKLLLGVVKSEPNASIQYWIALKIRLTSDGLAFSLR